MTSPTSCTAAGVLPQKVSEPARGSSQRGLVPACVTPRRSQSTACFLCRFLPRVRFGRGFDSGRGGLCTQSRQSCHREVCLVTRVTTSTCSESFSFAASQPTSKPLATQPNSKPLPPLPQEGVRDWWALSSCYKEGEKDREGERDRERKRDLSQPCFRDPWLLSFRA